MNIPYQKLSITITAEEELYLPYYKGSTFRGGFGNAFRRITCALRKQECTGCILKQKCIYSYVFETSSDGGAEILNMHKYEKVPHPFVIEPPQADSSIKNCNSRTIQPGTNIDLNLILIGRATDYLPYFIYTFEQLGSIGIGKGRGRFRVTEVKKIGKKSDEVVYNSQEKVIKKSEIEIIYIPELKPLGDPTLLTLKFITPLRIKYKRDLVVTPEFHILIRNLLRRLGLLYYFHCERQKPSWDHREIIRFAGNVKIKSSYLKWFDWERYSSRQDIRMKLGGLVGEITYEGDIIPFIPLLKAGEILHIGKATSFGLGKYRIV